MAIDLKAQWEGERRECLRLILRKKIRYILRRHNIKKDLIVGLVGERGGGKSGSGASLAFVDWMLDGIPVFSNMRIGVDFEVDDATAQKYGLRHGGVVSFNSIPLDLGKLLRFDPIFEKSLIFIDEINVLVSEARRSMTNTNLFSNRLAQEMRHLQSAMIFTSVNEMYVDGRLRELTDCFIRCEDTCNTRDGIARGKPMGIDFKWSVYFMTSCFTGETYAQTHKPSGEYFFHFKPFRGIYSDKEYQGQGMLRYGVDYKHLSQETSIGGIQTQGSQVVDDYYKDWSWLGDLVKSYVDSGTLEIPSEEIWTHPEALRRRLYKNRISEELASKYNVMPDRRWQDGSWYQIYKFDNTNVIRNMELGTN